MTREEQIKAGHIWHVTLDGSDKLLFEGRKTHCFAYVRAHYGMRAYRSGKIRIGEVIAELSDQSCGETHREVT